MWRSCRALPRLPGHRFERVFDVPLVRLLATALVLSLCLAASACGSDELTRKEAEDAIKPLWATLETENVTIKPGSGCFPKLALKTSEPVTDSDALVNYPGFVTDEDIRRKIRRPIDIGALEVKRAEPIPFRRNQKSPSVKCLDRWEELRKDNYVGTIPHQFIQWEALVTQKALQAGLPPSGGTVVIYKKEFVEVTGLRKESEGAVTAEYAWQWVPHGWGEKFGVPPKPRSHASVRFRKYDDGGA